MPIQNTESTLAAALGVSGTMSARKGLFPVTPLTMIWRRQIEPADALLSAVTTQAGIALAERTIAIAEGQWVGLDANGRGIVAPNDSIPVGPAFSGGDRFDPKGGITVLHGPWVADTSFFDTATPLAAGDLVKVGTGTVQGVAATAGCLVKNVVAAFGDVLKTVGIVERAPFGVASETPSGTIRVRRLIL